MLFINLQFKLYIEGRPLRLRTRFLLNLACLHSSLTRFLSQACFLASLYWAGPVLNGFLCLARAKLPAGVLSVPRKNKPLEVEGNQKLIITKHHTAASYLNLFLFMLTHLSFYACTILEIFPFLRTQLSCSLSLITKTLYICWVELESHSSPKRSDLQIYL